MTCRQCGATIADKALVCYKCGTATAESTFKPPTRRGRQSSVNIVTSVLAITLLALVGLYMQRIMTVGAPEPLRWLIVALAAAIVVLRVLARRR